MRIPRLPPHESHQVATVRAACAASSSASGFGISLRFNGLEPLETGCRPQRVPVVVDLESRQHDPAQLGPGEDVDVGRDSRGVIERAATNEQHVAVAAMAAGETRVVEIAGADHNDPALLDGEKLIEAVVELAERVCELSQTRGCSRHASPITPVGVTPAQGRRVAEGSDLLRAPGRKFACGHAANWSWDWCAVRRSISAARSSRVKFQSKGSAISFQWCSKALSVRARSVRLSKPLGSRTLRWMIE